MPTAILSEVANAPSSAILHGSHETFGTFGRCRGRTCDILCEAGLDETTIVAAEAAGHVIARSKK